MSNPDGTKRDDSPFVICSKHGTCRLHCTSSCNTRKLKDTPEKSTPIVMNTKDLKDYRRNQAALLKHLSRARNAVAEMDAITHGQKPTMHNSNVRDLRDLLGTTYSMALSTRLELWQPHTAQGATIGGWVPDDLGAVKPSDHPAGRGKRGLAARPATGPTGAGGWSFNVPLPKKKK